MIALWLIVLLIALIVIIKIVGFVFAVVFWLLGTLILAGLASWAAQSFLKYRGDFDFTMLTGIIGGILGIVLAKALGVPGWLQWPHIGGFPVLWTLVGAGIVVAAAKVFRPRRSGAGM